MRRCARARTYRDWIALVVFSVRAFFFNKKSRVDAFACEPFSRSEIEFTGASVRRCAGARTYRCGIALVGFHCARVFLQHEKSRVGRPRRCAPLPASVCYNQAELRTRKRPSKRMD